MTAIELVQSLAPLGRTKARRELRRILDGIPAIELASLAARWSFWAREKQLPPQSDWRTWGFLTGRGYGKTIACSHYLNSAIQSGQAKLICLLAQDEQSSVDIQVKGPSGLIATAPPWCRPEWYGGEQVLVWPNSAKAYVRTPEVPGKIRGLEYDHAWISELQSWPLASRDEAFSNVFLSTRIGAARVIWDATPKRRHPLLRSLLADAEDNPQSHVIVRGTTHENAANLAAGYVQDLERRYGNTAKGREELLGEMLPESETALVKQGWIDAARGPAPGRFARRAISIDPAVTAKGYSDTTGIIDCALGHDGKLYVLRDLTGKHAVGAWADLAIDAYLAGACDVMVAETNRGGQLVAQNVRAAAGIRGLQVRVLAKDQRAFAIPKTINIREVHARGAKEDRAEPLATAYERGLVIHPLGVSLSSLEDTLTTWEPDGKSDSPGDLDALVHAAVELLGLSDNRQTSKVDVGGLNAMAQGLSGLANASKQLFMGRSGKI